MKNEDGPMNLKVEDPTWERMFTSQEAALPLTLPAILIPHSLLGPRGFGPVVRALPWIAKAGKMHNTEDQEAACVGTLCPPCQGTVSTVEQRKVRDSVGESSDRM